MALIDHTNFDTLLRQSSGSRADDPNGNVYFDVDNNRIQLIGVDELATVDFGSGPVANPLNNTDGITLRGLYNFENQERVVDETLRRYLRASRGNFRFAGAFSFINGVKLDASDRNKIRNSGWIEYADTLDGASDVDRIYHGVVSLVEIQSATIPYWALVTSTDETTLQSATWTDFVRAGDINEAVQVFGSTVYGDSTAGIFDFTTRNLVVRVRSWGYNPGETTSVATGITEFSGFSAGYGVGETINTANEYDLANVYGGASIEPWISMSLEFLTASRIETGFNEADGAFTWILNNPLGGTVQQAAAFLDALTLQDADIDSGSATYNGRRGRVWYFRDAAGRVVTRSVGDDGLFIDGLSIAEKQNAIMTDDSGSQKTYPFFPEIRINVGTIAPTDPNAWYHVYYQDGSSSLDFNTSESVTVQDSSNAEVKGFVQTDHIANIISFAYAYDTNNQAGLVAAQDKDIVVIVEGDGIAAQAITFATITRTPIVNILCAPPADLNA